MNIGTTTNPEAEKILEEAELAAEKRLREQFPDVATGVAGQKKKKKKRKKKAKKQNKKKKKEKPPQNLFLIFS